MSCIVTFYQLLSFVFIFNFYLKQYIKRICNPVKVLNHFNVLCVCGLQ